MVVSIKKTVWMVLLVLALLIALFGWSLRTATISGASTPHHSGLHSSHMIVSGDGDNDYDDGGVGSDADDSGTTCPPPPREC